MEEKKDSNAIGILCICLAIIFVVLYVMKLTVNDKADRYVEPTSNVTPNVSGTDLERVEAYAESLFKYSDGLYGMISEDGYKGTLIDAGEDAIFATAYCNQSDEMKVEFPKIFGVDFPTERIKDVDADGASGGKKYKNLKLYPCVDVTYANMTESKQEDNVFEVTYKVLYQYVDYSNKKPLYLLNAKGDLLGNYSDDEDLIVNLSEEEFAKTYYDKFEDKLVAVNYIFELQDGEIELKSISY